MYSSVCPLSFADNGASKLKVTVGLITPGTIIRLHLQVTSTDGGARSHTSFTQIQITHREVPDVLVNHMYCRKSSLLRTKFPTRLKLNGTISWPVGYSRSDLVAEWKYEDVWNDGYDILQHAFTPLQGDMSKTISTSSYLPLVLLTDALPIQNDYTFTLSLYMSTSSSLITKTSITVYRNTPPIPGTLAALPATGGIEMDTVYTLVAGLWDDENLPLSYKFTYKTPASQISTVLQVKGSKFSLSTQLPAGSNDGTGSIFFFWILILLRFLRQYHRLI